MRLPVAGVYGWTCPRTGMRSKGNHAVPYDPPVPYDLVDRIVAFRVKEIQGRMQGLLRLLTVGEKSPETGPFFTPPDPPLRKKPEMTRELSWTLTFFSVGQSFIIHETITLFRETVTFHGPDRKIRARYGPGWAFFPSARRPWYLTMRFTMVTVDNHVPGIPPGAPQFRP